MAIFNSSRPRGSQLSSVVGNLPAMRESFFFPFEQQFDKFVNEFFQNSTSNAVRANGGYPKLDVYQDDEYFTIRLAVPGVRSEDIEVEVDPADLPKAGQPTLVIRGRCNEEYRVDNEYTLYRELHKSSFMRTITLPIDLSGEPEAVLKDGILTLRWLCKRDRPPGKKKIEIKT